MGQSIEAVTPRYLLPLLLAHLLSRQCAHAEGMDWLHVPKTGTSFKYAVLMHSCHQLVDKVIGHRDNIKVIGHRQFKGTALYKCVKEFKYGHAPLKRDLAYGHAYHRINEAVTMLRQPIERVARGFVHNLHDCPTFILTSSVKWLKEAAVLKGKKNHKKNWIPIKLVAKACEALTAADASESQDAIQLVLEYARCVRGCTMNMITGEACGDRGREDGKPFSESDKDRAIRLGFAKAKLKMFQFVGQTERWNEALCVFTKMFPLKEGYPSDIYQQFRPTLDNRCEKQVELILKRHGFNDEEDEKIYAYSKDLFEQNLANYPDCAKFTPPALNESATSRVSEKKKGAEQKEPKESAESVVDKSKGSTQAFYP